MKNTKKAIIMLLVLSMLLLVACGSNGGEATDGGEATETGLYTDGTYSGTGAGFAGDIEVEVVVKDGEISELNVVEHQETAGISDPAFESIEEQLIEKQSVEGIDTVSGATGTSEGLIEAITNALASAK